MILEKCESFELMGREFRQNCMEQLDQLDGYDWSGIYRLEHKTLVLDTYVGAETDHTHIPVGRGVCGAAVATGENQLVENVAALENYLSCSLETKSEIVVLIRKDGRILGQIDIDSHTPARFTGEDEKFLEELAGLIAGRWDDEPKP